MLDSIKRFSTGVAGEGSTHINTARKRGKAVRRSTKQERPRCGGMLVILARSARYMKLLPFSSDNARSGTRRGALGESSRAGRTGREGFVAGFRKAYGGGGPSAGREPPRKGAGTSAGGWAAEKGRVAMTRGPPPRRKITPPARTARPPTASLV